MRTNDNRPTWRPFTEYLQRFGERNRLKRENQGGRSTLNSDAEAEEKYWRDRERHHQEQQQFRKPRLTKRPSGTADSRMYRDVVPFSF